MSIICSISKICAQQEDDGLLYALLSKDTSAVVKKVLENPDKYRLQIVYTEIEYKGKQPVFKHHTLRLKHDEYFYPASLVKLPAAALALEKLNTLRIQGVDKNTPLCTNPRYAGITNDSLPYPGVAENILEMMVVSDNNAFNRIYDFLGQEYIHLSLFEKGYLNTRIVQRIASCTDLQNRTTGPYSLIDNNGKTLYEEEELINNKNFGYPLGNYLVGRAYLDGRKLIRQPRSFKYNNYVPLSDAHKILISIIYPKTVEEKARFNLTESDYMTLKKSLSMYPRETCRPEWMNDSIYFDTFRKFLFGGGDKTRLEDHIRIFNKVGMAYGFMSDCAYFANYKNNIEFFISTVIYVNEDEILNDNRYDYEKTGYPFLNRLGKIIYEFELTKTSAKRNHLTELDYTNP